MPDFLFFVLIICNTLTHSTLSHLKMAFIKKALFLDKPFCFYVCIELCLKDILQSTRASLPYTHTI